MEAEDNMGIGKSDVVRRMLVRFWVSCFVAFLFLRLSISPYWAENNRFFYHWGWRDACAIHLLIISVACLILFLYEVLGFLGQWGRRVRDMAFVAVTLFYTKVAFLETVYPDGVIPSVLSVISKYAVVVLCVVALFRLQKVRNAVRAMCLIGSPILIIFSVQLVTSKCFQGSHESVAADVKSLVGDREQIPAGTANVFIFLFDGWSYSRSFESRQVKAVLPGLQRVAEQSCVFSRAYSPSSQTIHSLPSLLYGDVQRSTIVDGEINLNGSRLVGRASEMQSMFDQARQRNLSPSLIGFYVPYSSVFSESLDSCLAVTPYKYMGSSVMEVASSLMFVHIRKRLSFIHPSILSYCRMKANRGLIEMDSWQYEQTIKHVRDAQGTFAFFHFRMPHPPLLYGAGGEVMDPLDREPDVSVESYENALQYVEGVISGILDALSSRDDYNDTLFVLLADHSFREDPMYESADVAKEEVCHIPLLIHLPGQVTREDISTVFCTADLNDLLMRAIDEEISVEQVKKMCEGFAGRKLATNIGGERVVIGGQ